MSDKPDNQDRIIDAEVEPLGGKRSGSRMVILLVGAVVVSIVIAVGWHFWSSGKLDAMLGGQSAAPASTTASAPAASTPATTASIPVPAPAGTTAAPAPDPALLARLEEQEKRLAALTASLERLQQLPAANAGTDPALLQKLAELEQQVATLRQTQEASAAQRSTLQTQIADLQTRFTALSEARLNALREPLLQLIAFSEARELARRGSAFAREATLLGSYAEAQGGMLKSAFAGLQPFAERGVPPAAVLAARFPTLAEQQRATPGGEAVAAAEKPWWQRAVDRVTGLVSIRRVGSVDSSSVEGKLETAEAALRDGDLAAAVTALDGVTLIPALQDWREQAQARLDLDAALDAHGAALRAHLAIR
ncbi:MAG: COG4223 family protein [Ferrovibrio sp.]|uniref:COG4223 family protein n=1 Tax=Ferrovibrio sp. TaxID=1917215 RepID=UPI00391C4AD0